MRPRSRRPGLPSATRTRAARPTVRRPATSHAGASSQSMPTSANTAPCRVRQTSNRRAIPRPAPESTWLGDLHRDAIARRTCSGGARRRSARCTDPERRPRCWSAPTPLARCGRGSRTARPESIRRRRRGRRRRGASRTRRRGIRAADADRWRAAAGRSPCGARRSPSCSSCRDARPGAATRGRGAGTGAPVRSDAGAPGAGATGASGASGRRWVRRCSRRTGRT